MICINVSIGAQHARTYIIAWRAKIGLGGRNTLRPYKSTGFSRDTMNGVRDEKTHDHVILYAYQHAAPLQYMYILKDKSHAPSNI